MAGKALSGVAEELLGRFGTEVVAKPGRGDLRDETETRGVEGHAEAILRPASAEEVAEIVAFAYERGLPITTRGGGTGYSGGCVPVEGGILLSLERMNRIRSLDPLQWRMHVDAGVSTATVRRLARENGLYFPPDPGAAETSQIGGNIATNAGGPHAFKYGVTGSWVTGLEVALPPGRILRFGGGFRKDVAGYDLGSLIIGSEGTLGVITGAWLRLIPGSEARRVVVSFHSDSALGCEAIDAVRGSGVVPTALEFLDAAALDTVRSTCPVPVPEQAGFLVLAEVDGSPAEADRAIAEIHSAIEPHANSLVRAGSEPEAREIWLWRDTLTGAVTAQKGGKVSEDIVVPVERLHEAIEKTAELGRRHGVAACSWGHAGDANLHSTFMIAPEDAAERERAETAAHELFEYAVAVGGSMSGEHGIGQVKRQPFLDLTEPDAVTAFRQVKQLFDPKGLMNPGKKI